MSTKKILALWLVGAMLFVGLAPVDFAGANGNGGYHVNTGLQRSTGGGAAPIVKAKWEMNGPWEVRDQQDVLTSGDDDDLVEPGAQFLPPGQWGATKTISFCAVVTDPDGVSDISDVYADFFFPEDVAFHENAGVTPLYTPNGGPLPEDVPNWGDVPQQPDYGYEGCHAQVGDEIRLTQLSKADGLQLFCDNVRNGNNNLPTFNNSPIQYDYDEICAETGELQKETAYVYCGDRDIIWEDPAGDYWVEMHAVDHAGVDSDRLLNSFEYLPFLGFEIDFSGVSYGDVKLNTHKRISGDRTFGTADLPSVRNTGNVRAQIGIEQDDMNFGTTDGQWNVEYDARVGNSDQEWKVYDPEEHVWLHDLLDLSEVEEMDFSILVHKFPHNGPFEGDMWIDARETRFRQCWGNV